MAIELQLDQMTIEEKLRAMEALWDDLCWRDVVQVPQWHKDILDDRQRLIDEGKAEFIDWETAKQQIRDQTSLRSRFSIKRAMTWSRDSISTRHNKPAWTLTSYLEHHSAAGSNDNCG